MPLPTLRPARYGSMAIALHWLMAIALVGMFAVGLYMTGLPFSMQRLKLYNWHKWAGVCVLALAMLRLLWRLGHRPPALPAPVASAMSQKVAWGSRLSSRAGWSATRSSSTMRRASSARGEAARTTMPSVGVRRQEGARTRSPSISTMHARQLPSGR